MSLFKQLFHASTAQPISLELTVAQERRRLFLRYLNRGWLIFGIVTFLTLPLFPEERSVYVFLTAVIFPTYLLIQFLNSSGRVILAGFIFTVTVNLGFYSLFLFLVHQMGAYQAFETQATIWMLMGLAVLFAGALMDKWAAPGLAFINTVLLIGTRLTLAPDAEPRPSIIVLWWMLALIIWLYERILEQAFVRILAELAERRQTEKALDDNRHFAEELYELTPDALLTVNVDGKITRVNAQALAIFGYPRDELLNKPIEMLVPDWHYSKHAEDRESYFENPRLRPMGRGLELFGVKRDGSNFSVEISLSPIHIGMETFVTAAVRDVTERKSAEQERESLISELETKNAELERFNYTVSHDLKTPLVTIKGFLGYLDEDITTGNVERLKQDTKRIANAVDKMNHLLRDLLELSRIGRLVNPSQEVALKEIVHEAIELVHVQLQKSGTVFTLQPNLPAVYGDKQRLVEVLQNLLDNSIKFMGDQKNPQIEIGQRGEDTESSRPVFFVKDNGIGIAPEYHERVFGLFNRLNPDLDGTGIGLTLVKRIIEYYGGRIWVESEAGQGTTFYFTLPRK